ncbi:hypothetical protein MycrhN_2540 [Mycolicibacterium rhodesiae NBB3]|uniref:Peptidase S74 domain-containing protein n=1 Tax=Mycolicibacterium rhodesiae (strain NBB3) TaxID=710685 RepID=G8RX78_MYCRN|nr:tail fiber domain-containing protein [Mycolicibacterium rhodesiae]AEV73126.1 hypothetical protein MycrhN_2540 [Mycolicibacterium rhodesiae NBB3]
MTGLDDLADKFNGGEGAYIPASSPPVPTALERLRAIRGVSFAWREGVSAGTRERELGVIAQEVESVFPEAVVTDPQSGYKLVDYAGLVAVLIEAVKELDRRVERLEAERGPVA